MISAMSAISEKAPPLIPLLKGVYFNLAQAVGKHGQ
jgi:hypothetical protein